MTLASLARSQRKSNVFTRADHFGANVAHQELVAASLRHQVAKCIHFYEGVLTPSVQVQSVASEEFLQSDLVVEFGRDAVQLRNITELELLSSDGKYVFLGSGPDILQLSNIRSSMALPAFPICSLVHAVNWELRDWLYVGLLLISQPWDVLVVTSEDGEYAVNHLLDRASELIKTRVGASSIHLPLPMIRRVPLAVDDDFLLPRDSAFSKLALGIPADNIVLLYLGRLTDAYKADLEPLLLVVCKILETVPNLTLLIAGHDVHGDYSRKLQALGDQLRMGDWLRVITNFSHSEKPVLYSASDIFVSPVDNIQETFGLSILEAMASSLPVIGSDWSGYRDLIEDGVTGFLIPTFCDSTAWRSAGRFESVLGPRCAEQYIAQRTFLDIELLQKRLQTLVSQPEIRKHFGAAGRNVVESKYSWTRVIQSYKDLWQEQIELRDSVTSNGISPSRIDQVFGHYASRPLTKEDVIELSELTREGIGLERIEGLKPSSFRRELIRILKMCEKSSHSLESIVEGHGQDAVEAARWALKKGYCRVSLGIRDT